MGSYLFRTMQISKRIIETVIYDNNISKYNHIGLIKFSPPYFTNDYHQRFPLTTAHISKIEVSPEHRYSGIGTKLLQDTEQHLKQIYGVNKIKASLWDINDTDISTFFTKNGYMVHLNDINYYDDGEKLVHIYPIEKEI
jgi:ribosomal protein S18 acetylase RimI-like enzyme